MGYFEGIDSERGIDWRCNDSLSLKAFLGAACDTPAPDHSTISRTRRLIDLETHAAVFQFLLKVLAGIHADPVMWIPQWIRPTFQSAVPFA